MDTGFVQGMRKAGKLAARTLTHVAKFAVAGVTTQELDEIARDYILSNGGRSACLGYKGYPKHICTSVNEVLCHGVPDENVLKNGDILNIDVTVLVGIYHGDTSTTVAIGEVSKEASALITAAKGARDAGIKAVRPFGKTGDIGFATTSFLQKNYPLFSAVREIGGHGIGKIFHDKPFIPGFGSFGMGEQLKPWTCLTVEPIIWQNQGFEAEPITPLDGYDKCLIQLFRGNGGLATQFEHTVLVTATGHEILTEDS
jgi:methionyl aminopeptidase